MKPSFRFGVSNGEGEKRPASDKSGIRPFQGPPRVGLNLWWKNSRAICEVIGAGERENSRCQQKTGTIEDATQSTQAVDAENSSGLPDRHRKSRPTSDKRKRRPVPNADDDKHAALVPVNWAREDAFTAPERDGRPSTCAEPAPVNERIQLQDATVPDGHANTHVSGFASNATPRHEIRANAEIERRRVISTPPNNGTESRVAFWRD